ncbi:MAG TPA: hypothetical protein P5081_15655 [Phycisphaerae bacterium]|nr:hypothetical protein [Phycisphaerae bacterium]HRW54307.1 hypothetical protein [Phycisphaerae bacterium]
MFAPSIRKSLRCVRRERSVVTWLAALTWLAYLATFVVDLDIAPNSPWRFLFSHGVVMVDHAADFNYFCVFGILEYRGEQRPFLTAPDVADHWFLLEVNTSLYFPGAAAFWPEKEPGSCLGVRSWRLPLLWGVVALSLPFFLSIGRATLRVRAGKCPACAYDLRGTQGRMCTECGYSDPPIEKENTMRPESGHSRMPRMWIVTCLAVVAAFWVGRDWRDSPYPRFQMTTSNDHMYLLDQRTGLVRVFRDDREIRRFDAPVRLDPESGDWLDDFVNPDPDDEEILGSMDDDDDDEMSDTLQNDRTAAKLEDSDDDWD